MSKIILLTLVAASLVASTCAFAQTPNPTADEPDSSSFYSPPTPVPDSPGFAILGVAPKSVTRPATPKDLGLALLNGVDKQGNLQSGLALDVNPFRLLTSRSLADYRDFLSNQLASRFSISAATSKGASDDDKSVRVGLGANWVPFDGGDPRFDYAYQACVENNVLAPGLAAAAKVVRRPMETDESFLQRRQDAINAANTPGGRQAELADSKATYDDCTEQSARRTWNYSAIEIGAGQAWISADGKGNNLKSDSSAFYGAFSLGFDSKLHVLWNVKNGTQKWKDDPTAPNEQPDPRGGQLVISVKHTNNESVADPDNEGAFLKQDMTTFGAMLRYGGKSLLFYVDASYASGKRQTQGDIHSSTYALGAEIEISDGLWLDVSGGQNAGADKSTFVLGQFKFSFDQSTRSKTANFNRIVGQ